MQANGIREILEEVDHEDSPSDHASKSPMSSSDPNVITGTLLFHHDVPNLVGDATQIVTKEMKSIFFPIYKTRVDCIVKVLHWPSVMASIEKKDSGGGDVLELARLQALDSAICYTALCTMTDEESENSFACKKEILRGQLRAAAELDISKARLLEQPDLTVLQAFFIYLVS